MVMSGFGIYFAYKLYNRCRSEERTPMIELSNV